MSDQELKLNSLSRYTKESPNFILEAHGHCEVPAGCGGVVLRWWNPSQGLPLQMWIYAAGEHQFFLDGKPASSGRPVVAYGQHALAFRIEAQDRTQGILMFSGSYAEGPDQTNQSRPVGKSVSVLSTAGHGWKYTLSAPTGEDWTLPGFDDSGWHDLVEVPVPKPATWNHPYNRLVQLNVPGLGIPVTPPVTTGSVWIRKVFSL